MTTPVPKLDLAQLVWREIGPDDDPRAQLKSTVQLGDAYLHVNAIAVTWEERWRQQRASDPDSEEFLQELVCAFGAAGPLETVHIAGREYAVFASPFGT